MLSWHLLFECSFCRLYSSIAKPNILSNSCHWKWEYWIVTSILWADWILVNDRKILLTMLAFAKLSVIKHSLFLPLSVLVYVSSPRKNPKCSWECSVINVSKVSAVLLAMPAESGEYCMSFRQNPCFNMLYKNTQKVRGKLVDWLLFLSALRRRLAWRCTCVLSRNRPQRSIAKQSLCSYWPRSKRKGNSNRKQHLCWGYPLMHRDSSLNWNSEF